MPGRAGWFYSSPWRGARQGGVVPRGCHNNFLTLQYIFKVGFCVFVWNHPVRLRLPPLHGGEFMIPPYAMGTWVVGPHNSHCIGRIQGFRDTMAIEPGFQPLDFWSVRILSRCPRLILVGPLVRRKAMASFGQIGIVRQQMRMQCHLPALNPPCFQRQGRGTLTAWGNAPGY